MHLQFRSPTINLFFDNEEFVIFLEHLKYYLSIEMIPLKTEKTYPVGILRGVYGDVRVFFMHYHSFEDAKVKWDSRKARIDFENLYIIMEPQRCDRNFVERFNRLPFSHKVIITDQHYVDIDCGFSMKIGFYGKDYFSGKILEYPKYGLRRYLDRFDYVDFFNNGTIRKRLM